MRRWAPYLVAVASIAALLWAGAHSSFTKYPVCSVSIFSFPDRLFVGFDDAGRAMWVRLDEQSPVTLRCRRPGGGEGDRVTLGEGMPLDEVRKELGPPDLERTIRPVAPGATVVGGALVLTWGPPESRIMVQSDGAAVTAVDCTAPFEASNGAHTGGSLRDDAGMRNHEGITTKYSRQRRLVTPYPPWPRGALVGLLEAVAAGCLLGSLLCLAVPRSGVAGQRRARLGVLMGLGAFAVHFGARMAVDPRPVTLWGYWDSGVGPTMLWALVGAGFALAGEWSAGTSRRARCATAAAVVALVLAVAHAAAVTWSSPVAWDLRRIADAGLGIALGSAVAAAAVAVLVAGAAWPRPALRVVCLGLLGSLCGGLAAFVLRMAALFHGTSSMGIVPLEATAPSLALLGAAAGLVSWLGGRQAVPAAAER
jgi:hypothetical protein